MYAMHDRAFLGHRQRGIASAWATLFLFEREWSCYLRKVACPPRFFVRWSSRVFGREIHVSAMSSLWLRVQHAEHRKYGADV